MAPAPIVNIFANLHVARESSTRRKAHMISNGAVVFDCNVRIHEHVSSDEGVRIDDASASRTVPESMLTWRQLRSDRKPSEQSDGTFPPVECCPRLRQYY